MLYFWGAEVAPFLILNASRIDSLSKIPSAPVPSFDTLLASNNIRLDIETRLASSRITVADIRNFIFHNVYGSMRVGFLDETETFVA